MSSPATQPQTGVSPALPLGSRLNEHGRLEIGGCDTVELAREYGTPAYVVAEDDLRARARAFLDAGRQTGHEDFSVVFASKVFPCTAVLSLFAQEGLWCDVASAGELSLALNAGYAPERIVVHGNAKSELELRMALECGVGLIVIDNFDEISRLELLLEDVHDYVQDVLIRVTPDVRGETHDHISTGQADSKFGFSMTDTPEAIARIERVAGLHLVGLHAHIGSQLLELDPFRREVAELARLGDYQVWDLGGGLGVQYTADQPAPPSIESYVNTLVTAAGEHGMGAGSGRRLLIEPGRALTANAGVTLYTVESVKQNVSRWVAVDGGMSDNLRPMLYGARYEAHVADRYGGQTECVLAGKHCESGDVIVRHALLDDPRPGDVIVTPATGAYGYAMASNYNGVPRPPVVFCSGGSARVVVRRETFDDLIARDV
ncbi:MAG: diaminopimelate decarboxylase [Solirubrobacteraceae bacterium]|jgi:diaminopimelate decarboxylase